MNTEKNSDIAEKSKICYISIGPLGPGIVSSDLDEYVKSPLWPILVDTVHALVMYRSHKRYVSKVILNERPNITPKDLSVQIGIPLGEALVILYELRTEGLDATAQTQSTSK
jgi:hypothetical protein